MANRSRRNQPATSIKDSEIKRAAGRLKRAGDTAGANRLLNKLPASKSKRK